MATAISIISRGMRLVGALQKGEVPDADESVDGLYVLNSMLDFFSVKKYLVYQILDESFTLTAGTASYTVGSGGAFSTTRPDKLEDSCYLEINNISYGLDLIDEQRYAAIPDKTVTTMPKRVFYYPSMPTGTIYFDSKPDQAYTFHLKSWKQLQQFSSLTTTLSLPPGYQEMIETSFAERYGIEFNFEIPNDVKLMAADARRTLGIVNAPDMIMSPDIGSRRRYNIYSDR